MKKGSGKSRASPMDQGRRLGGASPRSSRRKRENSRRLVLDPTPTRDPDRIAQLVGHLSRERLARPALARLVACGKADPTLLATHAEAFLELLHSPDEGLVADGLTTLSSIARVAPGAVWRRRSEILRTFERGSPAVRELALTTLAAAAASTPERRNHLSPFLVEALDSCPPGRLERWTRLVLPALSGQARSRAAGVLARRLGELGEADRGRLESLLRRHPWSSGLATFPGIFLAALASSA